MTRSRSSRKEIRHGGPPAFNKKDNVSGQFWIFAAFAEQTA